MQKIAESARMDKQLQQFIKIKSMKERREFNQYWMAGWRDGWMDVPVPL